MAYTVRINGFEVAAETAEEVRVLIGFGQPALVQPQAPALPHGPALPVPSDVATGRAGRRTTGHVSPNGRGFRWQFSLNGRRYTGPTVPTREEAEEGLRHALTGRGLAPEPRGCVQKNGNGYRWKLQHQGRRFIGPTVDTQGEAATLLATAIGELRAGREPATAPKYRKREHREAARAQAGESKDPEPAPAAPPPPSQPAACDAPVALVDARQKTKRQRRCGKCDGLGHFAKTCKRAIPAPEEVAEPEAAPPREPELIRVKPPQPPPPEPVHLPQRPASASRAGVASLGAFGAYSADVGQFGSVLPRDEEQRIAKEYRRTGDKALADRLVQSNLRLVLVIAREYKRGQHRIDDLVQEGNCGLIHAIGKFDPERGIKLSSYASFWIRAYILKFILTQHRLVKVGTTQAQRKLFFSLRKEREKLEKDGQTADPEVLAAALGVTVEELAEMETRMGASETSIDAHTFDGDGTSLGDRLPASPDARPDVQAETADLRHQLRHKLKAFEKTLNTKQRALLRERLLAEERVTLDDLAGRFSLSRQRMLQIEEKLKDDLREYLVDQMDIESLVA